MSATTVNAFPAMHSFTSPRSWFLAIIVLLHFGFFWALSNGLSIGGVWEPNPPTIVDFLPNKTPPPPAPSRPVDPVIDGIFVPKPVVPRVDYAVEDPQTIVGSPEVPRTPETADPRPSPGAPLIAEPEIDPRTGLSEPMYPSASIRANQTGTVILSVLVLENGRIGDVRIEQSSGHARLDESAVREARRWKLKPGTRDGVPVSMWKQIPITFRLKESVNL